MDPAEGSTGFTVDLRLLLGLLGAGSFGAGVLAVFLTDNGTGTGVLVAFAAGNLAASPRRSASTALALMLGTAMARRSHPSSYPGPVWQ